MLFCLVIVAIFKCFLFKILISVRNYTFTQLGCIKMIPLELDRYRVCGLWEWGGPGSSPGSSLYCQEQPQSQKAQNNIDFLHLQKTQGAEHMLCLWDAQIQSPHINSWTWSWNPWVSLGIWIYPTLRKKSPNKI